MGLERDHRATAIGAGLTEIRPAELDLDRGRVARKVEPRRDRGRMLRKVAAGRNPATGQVRNSLKDKGLTDRVRGPLRSSRFE